MGRQPAFAACCIVFYQQAFLRYEVVIMCSLLGLMGMPGGAELIIVAFVILILFGNRLPSVMRSLGQGITEFKKGVKGVSDEFDSATKIEDDNEKS
jgi:sec-independent protein translocase protein TatA